MKHPDIFINWRKTRRRNPVSRPLHDPRHKDEEGRRRRRDPRRAARRSDAARVPSCVPSISSRIGGGDLESVADCRCSALSISPTEPGQCRDRRRNRHGCDCGDDLPRDLQLEEQLHDEPPGKRRTGQEPDKTPGEHRHQQRAVDCRRGPWQTKRIPIPNPSRKRATPVGSEPPTRSQTSCDISARNVSHAELTCVADQFPHDILSLCLETNDEYQEWGDMFRDMVMRLTREV